MTAGLSSAWCVHVATYHGGIRLESAVPGHGLPLECSGFAYVLTQERELLPHAEVLRRITARQPRPRLIKVAVRPTLAQADKLAKRWAQ